MSRQRALIACLAAFFISGAQAAATPESAYYTAGVVEFRPTINSSNSVNEHLAAYIDIVASPAASETDIIVFPEGTLNNPVHTTFVPAGAANIAPCDAESAYADFLVKLSCVARIARKYLVINLTEKEQCSANVNTDPRPCATNGLNIYNTNVVLDRTGRVISRYRKTHLYNEHKNTTYEPELGMFETDFGVKFGHFICFDMLFYTPAQQLVHEQNITDFVLTTMFFSELPFLTAVQLQQSWAWGNKVNLLAAGASYPENGITGTGIFAAQHGALAAVMASGTGMRRLLVAQVPKAGTGAAASLAKPRQSAVTPSVLQSDIKLLQDPNITDFVSQVINTAASETYGQLCFNDYCCAYNLSMEPKDDKVEPTEYYQYRVGVFSGMRSFGSGDTMDVRICALYACTNSSVSSCGQLFDRQVQSSFRFTSVQLATHLPRAEQMLIMPSTLDSNLLSLDPFALNWTVAESSDFYEVHINSTSPQDNLLTFGIYTQYYGVKTSDAAPGLQMATYLLLSTALAALMAQQLHAL